MIENEALITGAGLCVRPLAVQYVEARMLFP